MLWRGCGRTIAAIGLLALAPGGAGAQNAEPNQNCAVALSPACLQRLGAGAVGMDPECAEQFGAYRRCLSSATAEGPSDPGREERAEHAYQAVKNSGDPAKLELVARRFPGTFWGELAAQDAVALRAGRAGGGGVGAAAPARPPAAQPSAPAAAPAGLDPSIAAALQAPVSDRATIRRIQSELARLGYYGGGVDGLWGPGSRAALARFESVSGLPVAGEPTLLALQRLGAARIATGTVPAGASATPDFQGPIVTQGGVAIEGYDPVAYFNERRAVKGASRWRHHWSGVTWEFATEANRDAFIANPLGYAPVFGGHCAYCLSKGSLTDGDPRYWTLSNGRLYLHSSKANADRWRSGYVSMLPKAEAEWRNKTGAAAQRAATPPTAAAAPSSAPAGGLFGPYVSEDGLAIGGYDPVAYFTEGAALKGSPEITRRWVGVTWAFVSAANRDAFIADPGAYAPQYGGHCAYCLSTGSLHDGDGRYWDISEGELYLHSTQSNADSWRFDFAQRRAKADANWVRLR